MTALVVSVFLASILGSLHCAGMCGAFVAFAVAGDPRAPTPRWRLHALYNSGRLLTYLTLGFLAGLLGSMIDLGGSIIGVQRIAGALAGATVATFGVMTLLRAQGIRTPRLGPLRILESFFRAGHMRVRHYAPPIRAFGIGLLTTLLPCGWLYVFVATAAGTGNPFVGTLTMGVFWVGTLPALIAVGASARAITGRFGRALPTIMPLAVTMIALITIFSRSAMPARLADTPKPATASIAAAREHLSSASGDASLICTPPSRATHDSRGPAFDD